jgi:hypothetical protein
MLPPHPSWPTGAIIIVDGPSAIFEFYSTFSDMLNPH